jgi:hypothetical protein
VHSHTGYYSAITRSDICTGGHPKDIRLGDRSQSKKESIPYDSIYTTLGNEKEWTEKAGKKQEIGLTEGMEETFRLTGTFVILFE